MSKREVIIRYQIEVPYTTTYGDVKRGVQEALNQLPHRPISDVIVNLVTPGTVLTYPDSEPLFRTIIKRTEFTQK
jgi:hypothetical protein